MRILRQLRLLSFGVVLVVAACDDDPVNPPEPRDFSANLLGANEVPQVTTGVTGTATMTVPSGSNQMTWTINVANVPANDTVTVAHIHRGLAGEAPSGNIVVDFLATFTRGTGGTTATATGTTAVPDSVFTLIAANRAYVNVHSRRFPGGVSRGQVAEVP